MSDTPRTHFICGFAAAVACLARDHDQPSTAADIISSNGLKLDEFDCCVTFDRAVIRKLFREETRLKP